MAQRPGRETLRRRVEGPRQARRIIACALAHRATRIAHALVRDQARYDLTRWT